MPTDKPARKALPSARPASGGTAAGGNDRSSMPSSTATPPQPGRGDAGDAVQQSSASRQRSASTSSSGSSQNLEDDLVVINSSQANASDLTASRARNKAQVPQLKGASAPSSSRKRDHDNMANASTHANDAGAGIAEQGFSENQGRAGEASFQPTKYQRILPRESGDGAWQPPLGPFPPPSSKADDDLEYDNYLQFCSFPRWMAEGMPGFTPKLPSHIKNLMPGNPLLPRPVLGGGQPTVGPSNIITPTPLGRDTFLTALQATKEARPDAQPSNTPVNNPVSNAANVPAGRRGALSSTPATFGQAQDLTEELSAQINGLISLSNRNEKARQERSQQDYLLIRSQVDTHSRQIESFQQTFKDLQAAHVRDEAARDEEMQNIHELFAKKQQEFTKKVDEPARQNQRKPRGPSSRG